MTTWLYVGRGPDELASGRPLAPGDIVRLDAVEVAANERLIYTRRLVPRASDTRRSRRRNKSKEAQRGAAR